MSAGAGKYDDVCTATRLVTGARAVIVLVVDGIRGSGFSLQSSDPEVLQRLPDALEDMARQIRADVEAARGQVQ